MISLLDHWRIYRAVIALKKAGVIAYPTEAVYGLGCDPFDEKAVMRLLAMKKRSEKKGFILIAASWEQVQPLVRVPSVDVMCKVFASWPGHVTWLLPASEQAPPWICGDHQSIAIRVTAHPLANLLCSRFGKPLVSTSANLTKGTTVARTSTEVRQLFGQHIDYILEGKLGDQDKPSEIRDALTGEIIRAG